MALAVSNFSKNIIQIENLDLDEPALYTILSLSDDGTFIPVTNFNDTPDQALAAGATISIDLINDGVFSLVIAGEPNTEYFFLADYNIKLCGKEIMEEILCDTCGEKDVCGKQAHYLKIEQLIKYSNIKNALYYIWNEIVQTQSFTDVIAADSAKLLLLSELTEKLGLVCDNCKSTDMCKDVWDSNGNATGNCGCK